MDESHGAENWASPIKPMSLEQFWLQKDWQIAALLLVGFLLGIVGLRVDSANAWKWYQSQPLTRSIFFILALFLIFP